MPESGTARKPAKNAGWGVYCEADSIRMFFLGFSSGLPLLLVLGTLGFWLREAGIELAAIGFMSWIGLAYGFKWLWAPLVDQVSVPILTRVLGRRRGWLVAAQSGIIVGLVGMAFSDPSSSLWATVIFACLTAFSSATQDIALDAYRIECAEAEKQAALAAVYQTGYRLAMIWAGAGALAIAGWSSGAPGYCFSAWSLAYLVMAASAAVGIVAALLAPEPAFMEKASVQSGPQGIAEKFLLRFWEPIADFFRRYGRSAFWLLLLVATYRISDVVMGVMANPFYADIGFSKEVVAGVSKVFGVLMTLAGAFLGGAAVMRFGILPTLMTGAALSSSTNLLFSMLALVGADVRLLVAAVSADNLAAGLSSSAFVAFMSGLTNRGYSASQYALLSSLMLLLPKFLAGFSGVVVELLGYSCFFVFTALIGAPVLFFAWQVKRRGF